jgi:hypothetical protein
VPFVAHSPLGSARLGQFLADQTINHIKLEIGYFSGALAAPSVSMMMNFALGEHSFSFGVMTIVCTGGTAALKLSC